MILDQDPSLLAILGQLLGDEGYDVTICANVLDRSDFTYLEPDVVVADATLYPGLDAQGVHDEPLRRVDGRTIPVVYCTIDPEIAAQLAGNGVSVLLKPFDLDALLALLSRVDY